MRASHMNVSSAAEMNMIRKPGSSRGSSIQPRAPASSAWTSLR